MGDNLGSLQGGGSLSNFEIFTKDLDVLKETLEDVNKSDKSKKKEGTTTEEATLVTIDARWGDKRPEEGHEVPYTSVSIRGMKAKTGRAAAEGDLLYTGETAQLKRAMKKADNIARSKLVILSEQTSELIGQRDKLKEVLDKNKDKNSPEAQLSKPQIEAQIEVLDGQIATIEESQKVIKSKIESRKRLISILNVNTTHGRIANKTKSAAANGLARIAKAFSPVRVGILKAASRLDAAYQEKFHHIPPKVSHAVAKFNGLLLSSAFSPEIQKLLRTKEGFEEAYNQIKWGLTEKEGEIFHNELTKNGKALSIAIFKENTAAQDFLLDKGFFRVSPQLLSTFEHVKFQTEDDKIKFLKQLFEKCKDPEDLSTIVKYLKDRNDTNAAKELVSNGLDVYKNAGDAGDTEKYKRCQMLCVQFGDNALFKKAFGVDPLELYGPDKTVASRQKARTDFLAAYTPILDGQTKGGQNILHHACQSDNEHIVSFLSEVMCINNERNIQKLREAETFLDGEIRKMTPGEEGIVDLGESAPTLGTALQAIGSRNIKTASHQTMPTMTFRNMVSKKLPSWLKSDSSIDALLKTYQDNNKKIEGARAQKGAVIKNHRGDDVYKKIYIEDLQSRNLILAQKIKMRIGAAKIGLERDKNPFQMRDKNFIKARDRINMNLANKLDRLHNLDGNAAGSFSSMVGHRQYLHDDLTKGEKVFLVVSTLIGKFIGCIGPTNMLVNGPEMGMIHEVFAINGPLFTVGGVGFAAGYAAVHAGRRREARKLGMDTSLSLYSKILEGVEEVGKIEGSQRDSVKLASVKETPGWEKLTPKQQLKKAMKHRDMVTAKEILAKDTDKSLKVTSKMIKSFLALHYFKDPDDKQTLLKELCQRCDQRKIFKLLNKQIPAGDKALVVKVIRDSIEGAGFIEGAQKGLALTGKPPKEVGSPQLEQYKGMLQVAAKLGDRQLLLETIETGKKIFGDTDKLFLFKIVEPKSGDTLLHLAMATKDVSIITMVADEMVKASEGQSSTVKFSRPRTGIFKKFRPKEKTVTLKISENIFDLRNKDAPFKPSKRVTDLSVMDKILAHQLDEAYGLKPTVGESTNGTFTELYNLRVFKERMVLASEIGGVFPFKGVLNLAAGKYIKQITVGAAKIAAHTATAGGTLIAATCVEFLVGCCVMAFGAYGGYQIGGNMAKALYKLKLRRSELDDSATQLANKDIPQEQLLARYAHGRQRALKSLKKEKLTSAETNELRSAFAKVLDERAAAARTLGHDTEALAIEFMRDDVQESIQTNKNKEKTQRDITRSLDAFDQEGQRGIYAEVAGAVNIRQMPKVAANQAQVAPQAQPKKESERISTLEGVLAARAAVTVASEIGSLLSLF